MKSPSTNSITYEKYDNSQVNSTIGTALHTKLQNTGYYSLVAIAVRKAMQGAAAMTTRFKQNLGSFINTLDPKTAKIINNALMPVQMSIYGFYTLWSAIHTSIKLKELWTNSGAYSAEARAKKGKNIKPLHAKIKTTLFAGGMNASDISCFILSCVMLTSTTITITSPIAVALLSINGAINFVHYGIWSPIQRTAELYHNLQAHADNSEQRGYAKKLFAVQMLNNAAKFTMGVMMAAGIAAILLLSQPISTIVASAVFVGWAATKLVYGMAIKPKYIDPITVEYREKMNGDAVSSEKEGNNSKTRAATKTTYNTVINLTSEKSSIVPERKAPVTSDTVVINDDHAVTAANSKVTLFDSSENADSNLLPTLKPTVRQFRPECN